MKDARNGKRLWSSGGAGFSSKSDRWETPAHVFAALDLEFSFGVDVCATPKSAKCRRFFTPAQDGLAQKWTGTCWMNPPYGRQIGRWLEKAADSAAEGATVVCLVPARPDTRYWHEQVFLRAAEVRFVRGRLSFGDGRSPAPFPSAIVVYRPQQRRRLSVSTWVPPLRPRARSKAPTRRPGRQPSAAVRQRVTKPAETELAETASTRNRRTAPRTGANPTPSRGTKGLRSRRIAPKGRRRA